MLFCIQEASTLYSLRMEVLLSLTRLSCCPLADISLLSRWHRVDRSCNLVIELFDEVLICYFHRKIRRRYVPMSCSYLQGPQEALAIPTP